jgi:RNA polymerase primary sigma factor
MTVSAHAVSTDTTPALGGNDWNLDAARRLSAERINELLSEYQATGDTEVRNKVIQANMRLVAYIASRFRGKGLSRDELISEGAAALIRATATFDTTRGVSFATYASRAIEHSMRRALGSAHEIVSIPSGARRQRAKDRRALESFFAEHGCKPIHEQGGSCGGTLSSVMLHGFPVSVCGGEGNFDPAAEDTTDETDVAELRDRIRDAVSRLGARRAAIVGLRFGLDNGSPRSWEEVAKLAGVTTREAKSITADALRMLRVHLSSDRSELTFPGRATRPAGAAA